jgi:hypothetical protein
VLPVTCTVSDRQRTRELAADLRAVDAVAFARSISPQESRHGRWTVEFSIRPTQTRAPGVPSGVLSNVIGPRDFSLVGEPPQGYYRCFEAIAEG